MESICVNVLQSQPVRINSCVQKFAQQLPAMATTALKLIAQSVVISQAVSRLPLAPDKTVLDRAVKLRTAHQSSFLALPVFNSVHWCLVRAITVLKPNVKRNVEQMSPILVTLAPAQ
jgi:hypothetical protein